MKLTKTIAVVAVASLLAGCGTLIPKKVELLQKKVQAVPDKNSAQRELERQVVQRIEEKTEQALEAAVYTGAAPSVADPIEDANTAAEALGRSVGPPKSASTDVTLELARKMDVAVAKLNEKLDDYRADNRELEGKKIEGTGLLQVPYFVWLGGVLVFGFFALIALKVVAALAGAANPMVGAGLGAVKIGAGAVGKALTGVVKGGEKFKDNLSKMSDLPNDVRDKVLDLFRAAHAEKQDEDTKDLIWKLTNGAK